MDPARARSDQRRRHARRRCRRHVGGQRLRRSSPRSWPPAWRPPPLRTVTASMPWRPLDQGDWYYRFRVGDYTSPVGSTRPAPEAERRRRLGQLCGRELPELRGRSVRRAPRSRRAFTRLRRLARRLHLRGCRRARRRSGGARAPRSRANDARRLSQPLRPLQDRSASAGSAPRRARGS